MVNQIVHDVGVPTAPHPHIVSISWGSCEQVKGAYTIKNSEAVFAEAEAAGIDVFVASGDDGPFDCAGNNASHAPYRTLLAVDYPSSSAYVLGVGGRPADRASSPGVNGSGTSLSTSI